MKNAFIIAIITASLAAFTYRQSDATSDPNTEQGIQFHKGSWEEALAKAKTENKAVFLDVYASWCGPCKRLKSKTFSDPQVAEYFNKHFVNVSADGEKGEGITLSKTYQVSQYPTLIFTNSEGTVLKYTAGFHNPNELIALAKSILK